MKYAFVIARGLAGPRFHGLWPQRVSTFLPRIHASAGSRGTVHGSFIRLPLLRDHRFGTELIGGASLLSNRCVPLALTLLRTGDREHHPASTLIFLRTQAAQRPPLSSACYGSSFSQVRSSFAWFCS